MNLREKQDLLISTLLMFDNWPDRYTHIIELGQSLPEMPVHLQVPANRLETCISRTFFHIAIPEGRIHISGSSNSSVPAGLIAMLKETFDGISLSEISRNDIYFHTRSGLLENLSYNRRLSLEEMINKIILLA